MARAICLFVCFKLTRRIPEVIPCFSSFSLHDSPATARVRVQQQPRDGGIPAACVEDRWSGWGPDAGRRQSRQRQRGDGGGPGSLDPVPSSDPGLQLHRSRTVEQHCGGTHGRVWYSPANLGLHTSVMIMSLMDCGGFQLSKLSWGRHSTWGWFQATGLREAELKWGYYRKRKVAERRKLKKHIR